MTRGRGASRRVDGSAEITHTWHPGEARPIAARTLSQSGEPEEKVGRGGLDQESTLELPWLWTSGRERGVWHVKRLRGMRSDY